MVVEVVANGRWPIRLPDSRAEQWSHPWEARRLDAVFERIRPGTTVIDVGAETGDMSVLYALWGASVAVVEPAVGYWPTIRACFELNGVEPDWWYAGFVSDVYAPVAADPEWVGRFYGSVGWPTDADPDSTYAGFRTHHEHFRMVPSTTLDDLPPADVICMDIEGGEYAAVRGAEQTIATRRTVWFLSAHPPVLHGQFGVGVDDVLDHFPGYRKTLLDDRHEQHWMIEP